MSISREQVADLQPGDVVRITGWYGVTIEGPVQEAMGSLWLGQHCRVTAHGGHPAAWMDMGAADATLTVVSRAPRPLYVNHPRTEPRRGDVARFDPDGQPAPEDNCTWFYNGKEWRQLSNGTGSPICGGMPNGLTLLVDGETGRCVQ